jgi:DNA-binding PadR family transcriptional regulator
MADVLGTFEQAVLLSILRLREQGYGRAILKEVQRRTGRESAAGAVYATLERLEAKGLVSSRLGSGTPIRDGRPRRYYTVTAAGVTALNDARETMRTIWRGFNVPLKAKA